MKRAFTRSQILMNFKHEKCECVEKLAMPYKNYQYIFLFAQCESALYLSSLTLHTTLKKCDMHCPDTALLLYRKCSYSSLKK